MEIDQYSSDSINIMDYQLSIKAIESEIFLNTILELKNEQLLTKILDLFMEKLKKDSIYSSFSILKNIIDKELYVFISTVYKHILSNPYLNESQNSNEYLFELLDNIFHKTNCNIEDINTLYLESFNMIQQMVNDNFETTIEKYFETNSDHLDKQIINTKSPEIILEYMKFLLLNEMKKELTNFFSEYIITDWMILDSIVIQEEYLAFLWFSIFTEQDKRFFTATNESSKYINTLLQTRLDPIDFFHNDKLKYNFIDFSLLNVGFNDKLLSILEKQKIDLLSTVDKEVAITSERISKKRETVYQIKNKTNNCPHCKDVILSKKTLTISAYKRKVKISVGIVEGELLFCTKCNKVFGNHNQLNLIIMRAKPNYINIVLDPIEYPPKKPKIQNQVQTSNKNSANFREYTDLFLCGYKITGLSRNQRWDKLVNRAIPNLTLDEIVNTIARNIRLRKAQKDGRKKFSYAIAEWEHDLHKLKRDYYRNNFKWPKY